MRATRASGSSSRMMSSIFSVPNPREKRWRSPHAGHCEGTLHVKPQ